MNLTFIGTGYVGLVSGVMMSHIGHNVTCLDTDTFKITQLKEGILPIYEPTLDQYLLTNLQEKRLKFVDHYDGDLHHADAIFITLGTPSLPSGEADLRYIFAAIDNVCKFVNKDCILVIKSTVPPGTANQLLNYLSNKNLRFNIASNPEFLREGCAVNDFLNPDRIVIGTNNEKATNILREIYKPIISNNIPLVSCDLVTSELIKYASNAFLATKIAFINEMANLCEKINANVEQLSFGIGLDHRIGAEFLKAGPGFGGSCFPKDILALSMIAKNHQSDCKLVDAVISANKQRPQYLVDRIANILGIVQGKAIAVLGLTFKAGTDDVRSSPAIEIIKLLQAKGANVIAFDPVGMNNSAKDLKNIKYADSISEACKDADAIVITTEWMEFKTLDFTNIVAPLKLPIIIDLRNILDSNKLKQKGFKYYSIGQNHEI